METVVTLGCELMGNFFFFDIDIFQFPPANIYYFYFLNLRKIVKILCDTV